MGSAAIELCPRCRRDTLPALKGPSWHRDVHRAPAKDMASKPDPRAERIKARKDRRQSLRTVTRESGFAAAATLFLNTERADRTSVSEECEDCQRLQAPRARFLGYDSKTNRAYAQIIK